MGISDKKGGGASRKTLSRSMHYTSAILGVGASTDSGLEFRV